MRLKTDESEALAASYILRCRAIARKLTRSRPWDFDESHSVAVAALDEAIRTHDRARGDLTRHVDRTVGCRVLDYLRSERPKGHGGRNCRALISADRPVPLSSLPDGMPPVESGQPPVGWASDFEDFVRAAARRLPRRHGEMIVARYLHADSETLEGCAARMGLKVPRVVQLHREAIQMLRSAYAVPEPPSCRDAS